MRRLALCVALLGIAACDSEKRPPKQNPTTATPSAIARASASNTVRVGPAPGSSAAGGELSPELTQRACALPCAGLGAELVPWRKADGKLVALEVRGSSRCEDSPTVFLDASGKQVLTIPGKPMDWTSPAGQELKQRRSRLLRGLRSRLPLNCMADGGVPEQTEPSPCAGIDSAEACRDAGCVASEHDGKLRCSPKADP